MNRTRIAVILLPLFALLAETASAIPVFARQYGMSCAACHTAFPRLNAFGEQFVENNFRLANWRDIGGDIKDDLLVMPEYPPLSIRAQGFFQARDAENVDVVTGERTQADTDFQSPYLIKLLSSAPLSEHISFYFYGIFAEKGGNGETLIEDAWFSHDDLFGSGVAMQLGQFQVSDLMFPREQRLTFQDYVPYRMAGITYERGIILSRGAGPLDLAVGLVNGNGISDSADINSPGFARPDNLFDNDNGKNAFGRIGTTLGPVNVGLFGLSGEQSRADGPAGAADGPTGSDKEVYGIDLSGRIGAKTYWYAQYLWNTWDDFLVAAPGQSFDWEGGFAGIDYNLDERWVLSGLYNYADAGDFEGSDTVFEGLDINSVTLAASYYFMRNVKGVIEINGDLLDKEPQTGTYFTGHLTRENYILFGFDTAF